MVKGLEKILKTTRNILLAGALGVTSLFIPQSNIIPQPIEYKQPPPSQPKLYTKIHSKLPEEKRKHVIELFENIMPYYIKKCVRHGWSDDDECNKLLFDKISYNIRRIIISEADNNLTFGEHLWTSWYKNYDKLNNWPFKDYGYIFVGTDIFAKENECNYGKIDIETTMLDDSWVEYSLKEKKEYPVIIYYDTTQRDGFSAMWTPLGFTSKDIIYINKKRIEEDVDNLIGATIDEINETILTKLNPSYTTFPTLLNLIAYPNKQKDSYDEFLESEEYKRSHESTHIMYLNIYNNIIKDEDYREKTIDEVIKSIFVHEASHIHQGKLILSNCNEKHIKSESDVHNILVRNELLSYITEFSYYPSYVMLENLLFVELFTGSEHGDALYELTKLYSEELNQPSFVLEDLKKMSLDKIKDTSKRIFINKFSELSNFNGCKIY